MRKGRLELWLGTGCVGLVLAIGLVGLYYRSFQALYYRWRFLHGEKAAAKEALLRLTALDPEGKTQLQGLVVAVPERDLTVIGRRELVVTVRNDRRHRVYVGNPPATWLLAYLGGDLATEDREVYIRVIRFLAQRSNESDSGAQVTVSPTVQEGLAWLAARAEPDPPIVTPHRVLDPGETAEFWVGPAR